MSEVLQGARWTRQGPPVLVAMAGLWRLVRCAGTSLREPALPRRLRVVQTVSLGGQRAVALLECDGERVLVGTSGAAAVAFLSLQKLADAAGAPSACAVGKVDA